MAKRLDVFHVLEGGTHVRLAIRCNARRALQLPLALHWPLPSVLEKRPESTATLSIP